MAGTAQAQLGFLANKGGQTIYATGMQILTGTSRLLSKSAGFPLLTSRETDIQLVDNWGRGAGLANATREEFSRPTLFFTRSLLVHGGENGRLPAEITVTNKANRRKSVLHLPNEFRNETKIALLVELPFAAGRNQILLQTDSQPKSNAVHYGISPQCKIEAVEDFPLQSGWYSANNELRMVRGKPSGFGQTDRYLLLSKEPSFSLIMRGTQLPPNFNCDAYLGKRTIYAIPLINEPLPMLAWLVQTIEGAIAAVKADLAGMPGSAREKVLGLISAVEGHAVKQVA